MMSKPEKKMEYIDYSSKIHSVVEDEDKGIVDAYAAAFGNLDQGLDIIREGAFKKTIAESKGIIPILADHRPSKQIGWNLAASEDTFGLLVKGDYDIKNNRLARERFSLIKRALEIGAKAGQSIGFFTIQSEPDPENPRIRILTELKLVEYSQVTFPMNTLATAIGAKSWLEGKADGNLGEHVDWFYKHMESIGFNHKDIRTELKDYNPNRPVADPNSFIQSIDNCIKLIKG